MVIMGPNAAGKSNFLDALNLLSQLGTRESLKAAFENHRGLPLETVCYAEGGIEDTLDKEAVGFSFQVDVELSPSTLMEVHQLRSDRQGKLASRLGSARGLAHRLLRYGLSLELLPRTGELRVTEETLVPLRSDFRVKTKPKAFLHRLDGQARIRVEDTRRAYYGLLGIPNNRTAVSAPLAAEYFPYLNALRLELGKWQTHYLEPRVLTRDDVPIADARTMGPRGENFAALLNTLKITDPPAFDNFQRTVQHVLPTRPRVDVEVNRKDGTLGLRIREGELTFSGRLISEGTLRVLGLVAAIRPESPAVLVGYEEPENGVHPVRIRSIADMLKNASSVYGKQIIVTTHSPLFAKWFRADDLFVCRKAGRYSVIEPLRTAGPLLDGEDIERALGDSMARGDLDG